MSLSCSPSDLAQAAKSFKGLSSGQLQWIDTYLLAIIAGGSTDPQTLAEAAKCYQCIPQGMLRRVQAYLLCQIASGGSGGPCPQDLHIAWTPSNAEIGDLFYYQALDGLGTATSFTYSGASMIGLSILNSAALASISLPNLTSIDAGDLESFDNLFTSDPALTSFSAPLLTYISGSLVFANSPLLSTLDIHSLVTVKFTSLSISGTALTSLDISSLVSSPLIAIINNSLLTSINLSSFVPTNGSDYVLNNNALVGATVNQLLARCVANAGYASGTINLGGQTPAAPPSGQGIADKAALILRGVTVITD